MGTFSRSEEHTSELQSRLQLVCRLLLEKKELCVLGGNGRSTGFAFEVIGDNELLEIRPNDIREKAQPVTLAARVSGQIGSGDVHCVSQRCMLRSLAVIRCHGNVYWPIRHICPRHTLPRLPEQRIPPLDSLGFLCHGDLSRRRAPRLFFLILRHRRKYTLFPYTTLFR